MEGDQFSLCWNNFHNNLSTGFNTLFQDEDLVDVTLAAGGKYLKAHKIVLSVCSPYFKELFRVNPCKHPIVFLPPDVNYETMTNLLTFIYQGEVNVRQEEIPMFMKIAEVLKIKGLTENRDTNGLDDVKDFQRTFESSKRKASVKKVIKPLHNIKPIERSPSPRSRSPPAKLPRNEDLLDAIETSTPLLFPKSEPLDPDDEFSGESPMVDMASMLDTTLGEPSDASSPSIGHDGRKSQSHDISSPGGGLLFLKSRKGHPVLIHNGHIYTLSQKRDNRSTWLCVKQRTLKCEGCVTTSSGPMLLSYSGHNHAQLHDIIQRLQASSCSPLPDLTQ